MEVKKIEELNEIINSVSRKLSEVPQEDFSKFLDDAVQKYESENSAKTIIKPFVDGIQLRNIIFETEDQGK